MKQILIPANQKEDTCFFIRRSGSDKCPFSSLKVTHSADALALSFINKCNIRLSYCSNTELPTSRLCEKKENLTRVDTEIFKELLKIENFILELIEKSPIRKSVSTIILVPGSTLYYKDKECTLYIEYYYLKKEASFGIFPNDKPINKSNVFRIMYG